MHSFINSVNNISIEFPGKDIHFLSISMDKDKAFDTWKNDSRQKTGEAFGSMLIMHGAFMSRWLSNRCDTTLYST